MLRKIRQREEKSDIPSRWESLTARECQIANLLVQGYTHKQIAKQLGIAKTTVLKHVLAIKQKLGLEGKAGVAIMAFYEREKREDEGHPAIEV